MSNEDKKETEVKEASQLKDRLMALRESKGDARKTFCYNIFSFLKYDKELDMDIMDAFFIKAIEKKFGKFNIEADITLMTLGLLDGYSYNKYPTITERRERFLKKSTYLEDYSNSNDENDKDTLKKGIARLVKNDTQKLEYLSEFLVKYKGNVEDLLNDINDYLNEESFVILPIPSYIKRDNTKKKPKESIIKYLYLGKETFTTNQEIAIKNDKYEIEVDISKKLADKLVSKKMRAANVTAFVLFLLVMLLSVPGYIKNQSLNPPINAEAPASERITAYAENELPNDTGGKNLPNCLPF